MPGWSPKVPCLLTTRPRIHDDAEVEKSPSQKRKPWQLSRWGSSREASPSPSTRTSARILPETPPELPAQPQASSSASPSARAGSHSSSGTSPNRTSGSTWLRPSSVPAGRASSKSSQQTDTLAKSSSSRSQQAIQVPANLEGEETVPFRSGSISTIASMPVGRLSTHASNESEPAGAREVSRWKSEGAGTPGSANSANNIWGWTAWASRHLSLPRRGGCTRRRAQLPCRSLSPSSTRSGEERTWRSEGDQRAQTDNESSGEFSDIMNESENMRSVPSDRSSRTPDRSPSSLTDGGRRRRSSSLISMAQTINEDICTFSARLRGRRDSLNVSAECIRNETWRRYNIHYFGRPEERFADRGGAEANNALAAGSSSSSDPLPPQDPLQLQKAGETVLVVEEDLPRDDSQQQVEDSEEAAQCAPEEEEKEKAEGDHRQGPRACSPEPRRKKARRRPCKAPPLQPDEGEEDAEGTGSSSTGAPCEGEDEAPCSSGTSSMESPPAVTAAKAPVESEPATDDAKAPLSSTEDHGSCPELFVAFAKGRRATPKFGDEALGLEDRSTEHPRSESEPSQELD